MIKNHSAGSRLLLAALPSHFWFLPRLGAHLRMLRNGCADGYATVAFLLLSLLAFGYWGSHPLSAAENDRVDIGEIAAYGGTVTVRHTFSTLAEELQIGGKIYVGDEIETSANGSIEILIGLNDRVRLAGDTEIRINGSDVSAKPSADLTITTHRTELLLRRGELRVRVRENVVTPTPVRIVAANMRLLLPRSDCLIRRIDTGPEGGRKINLLLGWGRAELNVKIAGEKEWTADTVVDVVSPGTAVIPELPENGYAPQWLKATQEQADKMLKLLPFSVDTLKQAPQDVPVRNPDMQGA